MRFQRTCIESLGYDLPDEIWTSDQLEHNLAPLYERLRLPAGRLELMTGIGARRVWPRGMLPSERSIVSGERALQAAGIDRGHVGVLIHASVCRDHLEPATACRVHHALQLPSRCQVYDLSNACLGLLSGVLQVANMIELGQVRAGLVVGTEDSRFLLETTCDRLNRDTQLTRQQLKPIVASLTIGSGSCAILLTDRSISQTDNRLQAAAVTARSAHHALCHSGRDEAVGSGMAPWMETDAETLLEEGIATGVETFAEFLTEAACARDEFTRIVCHQVGGAHRKRMLEALQLDADRDYTTFAWLGNTGSVALPLSLALGCQAGWLSNSQRLALLGIGSGINCVMLSLAWQRSLVAGPIPPESLDTPRLSAAERAPATAFVP